MSSRSAPFDRRIYTLPSFRAAIDDAFDHLDEFVGALRGGRLSRPFMERIMLAVTQVNGCRYCDWGHTRAALAAGVSEAEIEAIRRGAFDDLPAEELVALLYAQHHAATDGQPDPAAQARLEATYGAQRAQDIRAAIRMITIGNLSGNTFDALLSRLGGRPAVGSTLGGELAVLVGGPVYMLRRMLAHRLGRGRQGPRRGSAVMP